VQRSPEASSPISLPLVALGVSIDLHVAGAYADAISKELAVAWQACRRDPSSNAHRVVAVDADQPSPKAVSRTSNAVTVAAIDAQAGKLWMLHAAGVADSDGRVMALVGPSGTGKTTAALTLGRSFDYVTDETVAIAPDGTVVPYPKPLSIVDSSSTDKRQVAPEAAGLQVVAGPVRLGKIAFLTRSPESIPCVEPVATGTALVRLAAQSSYLRHLPWPLEMMAEHLRTTGGAVELHYSDAVQLSALVNEALA